MPADMPVTEFASMGGQARAKETGPKSLRGIGSLGYLKRCVTEICNRVDELSDRDLDRLYDALFPEGGRR
jgi:hypothetical protein